MSVKLNFTKRTLENLTVPSSGRTIIHDERTCGLVLKIEPLGAKSFAWYRKVHNYPAWHTIGQFRDLSIEEARHRADERNAHLAKWKAAGFEGRVSNRPYEQKLFL